MLADADDVAVVAVLLDPARAPVAVPAADVDLADDALADPGGVSRRRLLDDADELVAGDAGELGVAFENLKIGAADAGAADADETVARALGPRHVFQLDGRRRGDDECLHGLSERVHGPRGVRDGCLRRGRR